MNKFYGEIGFATETIETAPGVWENSITVRKYSGDILKNAIKWDAGENLNDDLNVTNRISIIADPFAYEHFYSMKYVKWLGALWKVTKVEVLRPRLNLTIGGVYNE